MGLVNAVGSGIGAIGMGVGKLGFRAGKGIWNAGAGGKGALIGGLGGGIYGAASAPDNYDFGDTMMRGLKGAGIGAIGGAVGGAIVGRGISKAKGMLAGKSAGPSANAVSKMANARAIREQMSRESVTRGVMGWRKTGGGGAATRLNREPRALTGARGAFGSAVRRAKDYKKQWMTNHRAAKSNKVYANARKMLPKARKDFWMNRAEPYLPPEGGWPAASPVSARPIHSVGSPGAEATPLNLMNRKGPSVTQSPIRNISDVRQTPAWLQGTARGEEFAARLNESDWLSANKGIGAVRAKGQEFAARLEESDWLGAHRGLGAARQKAAVSQRPIYNVGASTANRSSSLAAFAAGDGRVSGELAYLGGQADSVKRFLQLS